MCVGVRIFEIILNKSNRLLQEDRHKLSGVLFADVDRCYT